jgi:ABC-type cobalamin/Fe3+-siderophores transport system ATPase subunit
VIEIKIIEIKNLKKQINGKEVINIEYASFMENKSYALLGQNGSGKTTLLKILSGITSCDIGEIYYGDNFSFSYMPQKPYSFNMPVWKSMLIGLPKLSKIQGYKVAETSLSKVGALQLADSIESSLSGGESQRVCLARILLRERKVLFLDEPTSATDTEGCILLEKSLNEYKKQYGCTIIFSTHSISQARNLADEAVIMENGKIINIGDVNEILT